MLRQSEVATRLLFKLARRIRHVQPATPVTNRQTVREDVLAKPHRHLRVERLHETITKNVPGNHVGMPRTKDQIAVRMNSRPVERHETTLVSKRVEVVREPVVEIFSTQMAWTGNDVRR